MAAEQHGAHGESEHEEGHHEADRPTDWIERFGRHFRVTEHKHLQGENTREMLPWLAIAAELNPNQIETYAVASYFLRREMGKTDEAEQFLRRGLRANPESHELLFELGRLYYENRQDLPRARNIWKLALARWERKEGGQKEPDWLAYDRITVALAHLEREEGNYLEAIKWFEATKAHSPHPEELQKQIDALKAKLANEAGRE
jgi:tetratricopeptide (TPR) repeat protein